MSVRPESLCVHVLNVGDGDSIVLQFPADVNGRRKFALVDCYKSTKTIDYLKKLGVNELEFVCATHPHYDHIAGIPKVLDTFKGSIQEFWDSGFRHTSLTYDKIINKIKDDTNINFIRVTSGMERIINDVKVCVLAPSIYLRNRYDTYGVNINNASVVLKLEYKDPDAVNPSVIILGGDAQFDSWAKVIEEFPHHEKTDNPEQKVEWKKSFKPLNCNVLKVAHHGSKHGTALEYVEKLDPEYAIVSCSDSSRHGFPHEIAWLSLKEVSHMGVKDRIYFTDYSEPGKPKSGTTVVITNGTTTHDIVSLGEGTDVVPKPP
ncbi:MAG: MBL fold metallo-hydrolase [Thermoplasmata archaeon]|nr:MAG: MBL fold metallo-hydrolase [Thermoplasmata archaeon]